MSREIKVLFLTRICLAVLLFTVGVLVFGPFQGAEGKLGLSDKEAHALAFYAIAFMLLVAIPRLRKWDVAILAIAMGGMVEVVQTMIGRDGDIFDWLADSVGVMMAVVPMVFEGIRARANGQMQRQRRRRRDHAPVSARSLAPERRR